MKKQLLLTQSLLLLTGVLFSGFNLIKNFILFYQVEGTIFKIYDCSIPNPVTEACFYGSLAFLGAFIWSVFIYKKGTTKAQNYLWWFLGAGTIFAWYNVTKEFLAFYGPHVGQILACGGRPIVNPFLTPCFTGASIFLFATILAGIILSISKRAHNKEN